jgi:hypothetical protein
VVDSSGQFSQQIDAVVFDRQYTPFILTYQNQTVIPAESVYAVFEVKQVISAKNAAYVQEKAASVCRLHRNSLPVPHVSGVAQGCSWLIFYPDDSSRPGFLFNVRLERFS